MHDEIPFQLRNGTKGTAKIVRASVADGRTLIVCANKDEEEDPPVNMAIESLFRTVCDKYKLDPATVVWVEWTGYTVHTASGELGGWELVTWRGKLGESPQWRQMTVDDWRDLGTEPPPRPHELPRR